MPAKVLAIYIIEKGKPLASPAQVRLRSATLLPIAALTDSARP